MNEKAESIGLSSDPSGLALQELYKKSIAASNDDKVNSIPKSLQAEIDAIRQSKTPYSHYYNIPKAKASEYMNDLQVSLQSIMLYVILQGEYILTTKLAL